MEKAVEAKVKESGIVKFLGAEAKDAEIKNFFIDTLVENLISARGYVFTAFLSLVITRIQV